MSNVVVAISGGISAYKTCELVRLLKKAGHHVKVIMTACAKQFIGEVTLSALSGDDVYTDIISEQHHAMMHIELAKWADCAVIAPATATTLSALACGTANTLLTSFCLATRAPCHLVPAMNQGMWHHPATQENINTLQRYGYSFLYPEEGEQACGDYGVGRMLEPQQIFDALFPSEVKPLAGVHVLITAGPTYEKLDPIRYLGNLSSGKMGYAIAKHCMQQGATVHLISGPTALETPQGCQFTSVTGAYEMLDCVLDAVNEADIFICTAAIANYSIDPQQKKIKSFSDELTLTLKRTPDVLKTVCEKSAQVFCVGFCADSGNLIDVAKDKMRRKGCHAIVANKIDGSGFPFGSEDNQAFYVNSKQTTPFEKMKKDELACQLVSSMMTDFMLFQQQIKKTVKEKVTM